jgi:hypothetical protein
MSEITNDLRVQRMRHAMETERLDVLVKVFGPYVLCQAKIQQLGVTEAMEKLRLKAPNAA